MWLERAERFRTQQRHSKHKLCALHAPEMECIGKGKARKPYEFGVKVSLATTHQHGSMVDAARRGQPARRQPAGSLNCATSAANATA